MGEVSCEYANSLLAQLEKAERDLQSMTAGRDAALELAAEIARERDTVRALAERVASAQQDEIRICLADRNEACARLASMKEGRWVDHEPLTHDAGALLEQLIMAPRAMRLDAAKRVRTCIAELAACARAAESEVRRLQSGIDTVNDDNQRLVRRSAELEATIERVTVVVNEVQAQGGWVYWQALTNALAGR